MSGITGRIQIALVATVGLVAMLALGLHQAGFGWGQSSAARSVVVDTLRQLSQAEAPVTPPDPQMAGKDASAAEAAALDKTSSGFLEALRGRDYAAAWELLTNLPEGITQDQFTSAFEDLAKADVPFGGEALVVMLGGHQNRCVEVKTRGDEGLAHIAVGFSGPLWLALAQRNGAWAVDWEATQDLQARESVIRQLEDLSRGTVEGIFRQMMLGQGGGISLEYFGLLVLCPGTARHEAVLRRVDGQRAVLKLQTQAELHLLVELERGLNGWAMDMTSRVTPVRPDFRISDEYLAGERESGLPVAQRTACLANLKQLGLAMLMYCQDYDERFSPADRWTGGTYPYVKNELVYQCPAVPGKHGYAMNYKLSRVAMERLTAPAYTIMLFDSTLLRPNAYDVGRMPGASLPDPPRHLGYNNMGFTDGHVKAVSGVPDLGYYRPVHAAGMPALPPLGPPE